MGSELVDGVHAGVSARSCRGEDLILASAIMGASMRGSVLICTLVCAWFSIADPAQAQARWTAVETSGFVVYATGSDRRAQTLAAELEQFDGLLRRMTGAPAERAPSKLQVYMFGPDEFHDAFPYFGPTIQGVYTARSERVAAYAVVSLRSGISAQDVLFHEYAHHFMYQYFNNAYPAWYIEGFAEVVSTAELGSERIVLGRSNDGRVRDLTSGTWLPMERLLTGTPFGLRDGREVAMFYAQSWLFAHYLLLTPGANAQFMAYVRELRSGRSAIDAFQTGFGVTPAQMQGTLRGYLRGNPNAIALMQPALVARPQMDVTQLPPSANRLMALDARLNSSRISDEDKASVLAHVRQIAGPGPYDEFALFTLARAEIELGSPETARTLLRPYVEANPNSRDALYLMGRAYLQDAEALQGEARTAQLAEARRYFTRGFRIDGNHVPTLARYADTYDGVSMSGATWENYLNILLLARQLAPQVDDISLRAANVLIAADRPREAIPILRALAYDPHAGGSADLAQRLLTEAENAVATAPAN